ncbi:hypothetical protein OEB99_13090 [Actinotalea sp. M2MS4P-6]|uniref:hypothetical protein n=1 Tax=Actinotalea sp. M2MS4P-6 TaxID=2983762 RepID=UPI0021E392EC|nr:hypothetical protein [Actinotalea sp. M2MS4P-6]MCV2395247.1 hypothetical protein [Actinotalea sp. M2MS4P-6]
MVFMVGSWISRSGVDYLPGGWWVLLLGLAVVVVGFGGIATSVDLVVGGANAVNEIPSWLHTASAAAFVGLGLALAWSLPRLIADRRRAPARHRGESGEPDRGRLPTVLTWLASALLVAAGVLFAVLSPA